jgi:hypothetical protein
MMSVVERRECDVFKKGEAKAYLVSISEAVEDGDVYSELEVDLSPAAYKRLLKFIERGIHPPGWKPPKG